MRFTLSVDMANAAFDETPELELGAILDTVRERLRDGLPGVYGARYTIRDSNGNTVGYWTVETGEA